MNEDSYYDDNDYYKAIVEWDWPVMQCANYFHYIESTEYRIKALDNIKHIPKAKFWIVCFFLEEKFRDLDFMISKLEEENFLDIDLSEDYQNKGSVCINHLFDTTKHGMVDVVSFEKKYDVRGNFKDQFQTIKNRISCSRRTSVDFILY